MRFLHTSDLHIGKTVCGFSMLEEQQNALEQMIRIVDERKVDAVLISGDLYDRALPPAQAVTLLDDFLTRLIDMGVMVCAIAGNHDSGERIGFVNRILEHRGLYLEGSIREQVRYVDWSNNGERVRFHLLPFSKPAQVRELYHTEAADYDAAMRTLMQHVEYLDGGKNILLAHQFVVHQGVEPELSDSETRISVGGVDRVEASQFERFDYVALGHIHGPQQIGDGPVYYSGSPVKYSFSEVHHRKSVVIGEWDDSGKLCLERVSITPVHDMRKIKGTLQQLTDPAVVSLADEEDYLLAVLTNEEELADPMGTLRSVYPNMMQMQIERAKGPAAGAEAGSPEGWNEKTPYELFTQFYRFVTDLELNEEQQTLIKDVIEQAKEEDQ